MKTYWDYDEKERAELTDDEVRDLLKYELMGAGVIAVPAPGEKPAEPEIDGERITIYGVGEQYGTKAWFESRDDASKFAASSFIKVEREYGIRDFHYVTKADDVVIEAKEVWRLAEDADLKSRIKQHGEKVKAWEEADEAYKKSLREVNEACESVWEDFGEQCRLKREADQTASLWREYVTNCDGNEEFASRFLAKVRTREQIAHANDWANAEIPVAFNEQAVEMAEEAAATA